MARVLDLKIFGGHRFNSHSGHWVEMFLSQLQLSRTSPRNENGGDAYESNCALD